MKWSSRRAANMLVGEPSGRVDEHTWEAFLAAFTASIGEAASVGGPMTLDLAGIDYMSSKGLRVLMLAKREADARGVALTLARPNALIREILEISKYDRIFTLTDSLEA